MSLPHCHVTCLLETSSVPSTVVELNALQKDRWSRSWRDVTNGLRVGDQHPCRLDREPVIMER